METLDTTFYFIRGLHGSPDLRVSSLLRPPDFSLSFAHLIRRLLQSEGLPTQVLALVASLNIRNNELGR